MQVVSPGGIIGPTLNNQKHSFTLDNTHHSLKRNETNSFTMLLSQIEQNQPVMAKKPYSEISNTKLNSTITAVIW